MKISSLIRQDNEYRQALLCAGEQKTASKPLPIVVNGLTGGAFTAFAASLIEDFSPTEKSPALLLSDTPENARRLAKSLTACGITSRTRVTTVRTTGSSTGLVPFPESASQEDMSENI